MKIFQIIFLISLILSFSLIGSGTLIPNSSAQEETQMPSWIKNVAGWWADNEISENEFLAGIEYLVNNNIISITAVPCNIPSNDPDVKLVPGWVKNNAKWWSEDLIEDTDFLNGIEYLIKNHIIGIDNTKITGKVSLEDIIFSPAWDIDKNDLVFVQSSFFEIYGVLGDCVARADESGHLNWESLLLGLNPNRTDMYNEVAVWNDSPNTVFVYPYFTASAYAEPGFYTYYRGECSDCTTTKITAPTILYTSSGIGQQALNLLGYSMLTDIQVDKNPGILQQFDKVIMLHNEYVTRAMFDAITSHPNVVYLYPNALYAEVEVDYVDNTITLIRGHGYPEPGIENGFDWKLDNTHPYEFDNDCVGMQFYKIKNGWMTTCYPENIFLTDSKQLFDLLRTIKDL